MAERGPTSVRGQLPQVPTHLRTVFKVPLVTSTYMVSHTVRQGYMLQALGGSRIRE